MKSIYVLTVLIVMGLALFGCTYSAQYNLGNNTTNASQPTGAQPQAGAAPSGPAQPSGNAADNGTGNSQSPGTAQNATQPAGAASTPPGTDLSGKTYSDLINSGTPSQCTLTMTNSSGGTVTLSLFFDGQGSMRMEQADTGSTTCPSAALVFKGDSEGNGTLYLSCPGNATALGTDFSTDAQCDWNAWNISSTYGGIGSSTMGINDYQSPMIGSEPASGYDCQPWVYDSSKFDTPGQVCAQ